jgi:hypothetical protein
MRRVAGSSRISDGYGAHMVKPEPGNPPEEQDPGGRAEQIDRERPDTEARLEPHDAQPSPPTPDLGEDDTARTATPSTLLDPDETDPRPSPSDPRLFGGLTTGVLPVDPTGYSDKLDDLDREAENARLESIRRTLWMQPPP